MNKRFLIFLYFYLFLVNADPFSSDGSEEDPEYTQLEEDDHLSKELQDFRNNHNHNHIHNYNYNINNN
jgi:hypothetical protein